MAGKSPEEEHPVKAFGWAAKDSSGVFSPFKFSRRATGEKDVRFKVLYCGICHSDLAMVKNEWGMSQYPIVPGHEIVGVVTEVGSKVERFKVGDNVGVGCLVGSCMSCDSCTTDLENYCPKQILTYAYPYLDGTITYGGYSDTMVADEHFVLSWPENLPLDGVSATHPIAPLIGLLKAQGKLILVGAPEKPLELPSFSLIVGRKIVAGSCIGGLKETQEMLDFSAKHNITADVEVVPIDYVNTAMERLAKADVRYRFVIDVAGTLKAA
ncbi:hypothetical protein RJ639_042629 [Escallonia herrerae]|uniref:Alcohol dehydrogenase-like N-terminal domain-containing protein n=1 Tax=Escallonia herrerae TaxID=1293975 RepID=A0AA89B2T8_9ASTE|nr:hypothetical protein RJ639_042629 [Escallonia herrerae]